MDCELKRLFLRVCTHDDLLHDGAEDHLLECRWTAIALPYFSKVLSHRQDSSFFVGGKRISLSVEAGQSLFGGFDLLQLFVPAPLQLAGHETIPGIHRVVLL